MSSVIAIPTTDEIPPEMRESTPGIVKPRLPKIDPANVPEPLLWHIIVLPVAIPTETESGLTLAPDTIRHMNLSKRIGVVLGIGPLAYSQHRGFPDGYQPIEVGDWINFHEHAGVDTTMHGDEGLVMIKYLVEKDILGKPRRPELHMVMI